MIKIFNVNYHSFIDVITNSSTEMFISTDQKIATFFEELFPKNEQSYNISIKTFKEYFDEFDLTYEKDAYPEDYEIKFGKLKDDDKILVLNMEYQNDDTISKILEKLGFISIND